MLYRSATICVAFCAALIGCSSNTTSTLAPARDTVTATPFVGPQTWKVSAGSFTSNEALQALSYYPAAITIDAGDTVTWVAPAAEPHTISIPVPGTTPPPATDPTAQSVVGGGTYDGSAYVSSGFIGGGATYSITFTKPGTYSYYSLPQGFVTGTVVVAAAGTAYPHPQSYYDSQATSEIANDISIAQGSVASIPFGPGSNTIAAGVSPGGSAPSNGTVMRFLDGPTLADDESVTVAVGTTLTFENLSNDVPHTVTFPALGGSLPAGPPFQPGTGTTTYDGTALVNSGVIAPGGSFKLTFTKAGTFPYYCLFHNAAEGMVASITVQ